MRGLKGDATQRSTREKQNALAIGVLLVATIIALIALLKLMTVTPDTIKSAASVTMTGSTACLPHKASGPTTLECTVGLKGDDGRYYALEQLPPEFVSQLGRVRVQGILTEPKKNEIYNIAGTIAIATIERQ